MSQLFSTKTVGNLAKSLYLLIFAFLIVKVAGFELVLADTLPETVESKVLITEIKLGGVGLETADPKEFFSVYNQSNAEIDLSDLRIEYAKEGFEPAHCQGPDWSVYSNGSQTGLSGLLPSQSVMSFEFSLTDSKDGSLRLVEDLGDSVVVHDLVGWGEAAPCFETEPTLPPSTSKTPGESIQRYLGCELGLPVDTGDNAADFFATQEIAYGQFGGQPAPECEEPADEIDSSCEGLQFSEILPNPEGADSGREFIELYNPTADFIWLDGCGLATSASSKIYWFDDGIELEPGDYRAFFNGETGLTLTNSAGGAVYLLGTNEEELDSADYQAGLNDDVAWAKFLSGWQATYHPTPNVANKLLASKPCPAGQERSSETGRCRSTGSGGSTLKPCEPGKARNPETNRCRSVLSSSSSLKPCGPGRERNPATNRCRSTALAASSLKPCASDQFRNPATNRCKKKDSGNSLKPCKPGQERNPATNRCRKVATLTSADGTDGSALVAPATIPPSSLSVGVVATTAALGLLYGAYEFRGDIKNKLQLLRRNLSHRWHSGG